MRRLVYLLSKLLEDDEYERIRNIVDMRIKYFKDIGKSSLERIFIELAFCILTANYRADKAISIQRAIWSGFLNLSYNELKDRLRKMGYRYPSTRARYIVDARGKMNELKEIIYSRKPEADKRIEIKNLIKGVGMKEASHFLRNIGYDNIAIIDRHIIGILYEYGFIPKKYNRLTTREYIYLENILKNISVELNLTLSRLDLYLWYLSTGTIMK